VGKKACETEPELPANKIHFRGLKRPNGVTNPLSQRKKRGQNFKDDKGWSAKNHKREKPKNRQTNEMWGKKKRPSPRKRERHHGSRGNGGGLAIIERWRKKEFVTRGH